MPFAREREERYYECQKEGEGCKTSGTLWRSNTYAITDKYQKMEKMLNVHN